MAYRPVSDEEWAWLRRRFAAFDYHPELRQVLDDSLDESPYSPAERRQFRREVFDAIRRLASPREAYPNPYFEITWFRAVKANPELTNDLAHNRAVLYDAFYRRPEPEARRRRLIEEWNAMSDVGPGDDRMETITDGEELAVE